MVAEVEVDQDTGHVAVRRCGVALDCGPVSNPDGVRNQIEGGVIQEISRTLREEVTWDAERVTSVDWRTYGPWYPGDAVPLIESVQGQSSFHGCLDSPCSATSPDDSCGRDPAGETFVKSSAVAGYRSPRRFGHAWVSLTMVLACHVADEALTDFLSVYNPIVREARARLGWFPMPEFTVGVWLAGLCVLLILLLALSPFAYRESRTLRAAAYPYAAVMFLNGIGHLAGSMYLGRWAPGATTAPLLIVASLWLVAAARAHPPRQQPLAHA